MPNANSNGPLAHLKLEALEDRTVLSPFGATRGLSLAAGDVFTGVAGPEYVTGTGPGTTAIVRIYGRNGTLLRSFNPFGDFTGGTTVATGDVNADGVADILCGTGPGTTGRVKVFSFINGSLQRLSALVPFGPNFTGGVNVAAGVVTGADPDPTVLNPDNIVVSIASNGLPAVKVFTYSDVGTFQVRGFMAYNTSYLGGVTLAVANIDTAPDTLDANDLLTGRVASYAEIITGRATELPQVKIFDAQAPTIVQMGSFLAFDITDPANRQGVTLAAGDTTEQRGSQIYVNLKGGATIRIFDGQSNAILGTIIGLPKNGGNPPRGLPNTLGSNSRMLTMAIADVTQGNPVDNQFTDDYFTHDLLVAAADGAYAQVPQVFFSGAQAAGLNGSRPGG